ncbi:MAG TPA: hypothetical protein VF520_08040 [Thermoleophilaceae bacterium]|jgi:hypothetical protein
MSDGLGQESRPVAGGAELRPSGDFARLVLREIEPDDYGRRRWTRLDREFAALVWLNARRDRERAVLRAFVALLAICAAALVALAIRLA